MYQLIRTWKERQLLPEAPKILKAKNTDGFVLEHLMAFKPALGFLGYLSDSVCGLA